MTVISSRSSAFMIDNLLSKTKIIETDSIVSWSYSIEFSSDVLFFKENCVNNNRRKRKSWTCDVCGKMFDRPSLLSRHTRTHTGWLHRKIRSIDCFFFFVCVWQVKSHMHVQHVERLFRHHHRWIHIVGYIVEKK